MCTHLPAHVCAGRRPSAPPRWFGWLLVSLPFLARPNPAPLCLPAPAALPQRQAGRQDPRRGRCAEEDRGQRVGAQGGMRLGRPARAARALRLPACLPAVLPCKLVVINATLSHQAALLRCRLLLPWPCAGRCSAAPISCAAACRACCACLQAVLAFLEELVKRSAIREELSQPGGWSMVPWYRQGSYRCRDGSACSSTVHWRHAAAGACRPAMRARACVAAAAPGWADEPRNTQSPSFA